MIILLTQYQPNAINITGSALLDFDTRRKSRARIRLDNGDEAGLMLPRGIILRDGDIISDDSGNIAIRIKAKPEQVSTVTSPNHLLLAIACYHLGNRHVPLQIHHDFLRYQHDHVLDAMLKNMGLTIQIEQAPFEPENGAYHQHNHHH